MIIDLNFDYVLREAHFLILYGPFSDPIMCTGHHYLLHYHSSIVCLHVVVTLTTQNIMVLQFKHVLHFHKASSMWYTYVLEYSIVDE